MKRIICLLTVLCLILGSFSFCFAAAADWSTTDQQNLSNVAGRLYYMNQSAAYYLYQIYSRLGTISNTITDIKNALFDDNNSVAYWTSAIASWMSPIYNSITQTPVDLAQIIGALGYTQNGTYHPYLIGIEDMSKALTNKYKSNTSWNTAMRLDNAHYQLVGDNGAYGVYYIGTNGTKFVQNKGWFNGSPIGNLAVLLQGITNNQAFGYENRWASDLTGYNSQQALVSFADPDSTVTFTPLSAVDGLYKYLNALNTPLARLGYTLASDERIEAQEAAAANEQAVVDNFIDSTGDGSASPSDIGSISDLSAGYKSNFGSDASVTGIFNIFNSNNMGWFSQETANQLDTASSSRRGSSFDTPLLDQQINDIYDQIGVKHD